MIAREIVVPVSFAHTDQATLTAPWYVEKSEYHPVEATYKPLINGEEAFRAVHEAIAAATKSIDIICWGFQPSMYFIRDGKAVCIGELLMEKARSGVEVRVLAWEFPQNLAGKAGEGNLPGKSPRVFDRIGQSSTDKQYDFDRKWFDICAQPYAPGHRFYGKVPVFLGRGFGPLERVEISYLASRTSLDRDLSFSTIGLLGATPTHHQKTVLVDYEVPERAVGFVMGHNMLDEYWDTDLHSAKKRNPDPKHWDRKPAPDLGPRGITPRQDISCQITGPILEHLHHNFAQAWRKDAGEDLIRARNAMEVAKQLKCAPDQTKQIAQLVRTQAQEGKRDIEKAYLQAVNNASQFIYIENQYFRWPPLAELITSAAAKMAAAGRDPGDHGPLHLFVITNATDAGMGAGVRNTQRMLEALGRADTMPSTTKLLRIKKAKVDAANAQATEARATYAQNHNSRQLYYGHGMPQFESADAMRSPENQQLAQQIKDIENNPVRPVELPGLKIHVCSLVAPDTEPGWGWVPVYIHSKLMIVDDVFTTHGSANINTRSMQVDSEMNIIHEWGSVTQAMRRRLWDMHTAGMGAQDDPEVAFKRWQVIIDINKANQEVGNAPYAPLVEFFYDKATVSDMD